MLPSEPTTPPNSLVWRIIHFPLVLLVLGIVTIAAAGALAGLIRPFFPVERTGPLAIVFSLIVAAIFIGAYMLFVRWIERRPVDEFGATGWASELGGGLLAGFVLFSVVIGIIAALGGYRVIGSNPATALYPAIAIAITSGVTEEIVLRGLFFRLIERLAGSWIALALSAALFGALHLGNPDATRDQIVAAAKAVGAHEFIESLPGGYDTDVNKRGGRVSAGQRQLLSFARAFLADPVVLILDEATASLDIPSERLVQEGLTTLLADRTAIIIAHRLSTVAIADRVLVMEHGIIVEDGTPRDLIAGTGRFSQLHAAWRDSLV